jgi:hypothetical protein
MWRGSEESGGGLEGSSCGADIGASLRRYEPDQVRRVLLSGGRTIRLPRPERRSVGGGSGGEGWGKGGEGGGGD